MQMNDDHPSKRQCIDSVVKSSQSSSDADACWSVMCGALSSFIKKFGHHWVPRDYVFEAAGGQQLRLGHWLQDVVMRKQMGMLTPSQHSQLSVSVFTRFSFDLMGLVCVYDCGRNYLVITVGQRAICMVLSHIWVDDPC